MIVAENLVHTALGLLKAAGRPLNLRRLHQLGVAGDRWPEGTSMEDLDAALTASAALVRTRGNVFGPAEAAVSAAPSSLAARPAARPAPARSAPTPRPAAPPVAPVSAPEPAAPEPAAPVTAMAEAKDDDGPEDGGPDDGGPEDGGPDDGSPDDGGPDDGAEADDEGAWQGGGRRGAFGDDDDEDEGGRKRRRVRTRDLVGSVPVAPLSVEEAARMARKGDKNRPALRERLWTRMLAQAAQLTGAPPRAGWDETEGSLELLAVEAATPSVLRSPPELPPRGAKAGRPPRPSASPTTSVPPPTAGLSTPIQPVAAVAPPAARAPSASAAPVATPRREVPEVKASVELPPAKPRVPTTDAAATPPSSASVAAARDPRQRMRDRLRARAGEEVPGEVAAHGPAGEVAARGPEVDEAAPAASAPVASAPAASARARLEAPGAAPAVPATSPATSVTAATPVTAASPVTAAEAPTEGEAAPERAEASALAGGAPRPYVDERWGVAGSITHERRSPRFEAEGVSHPTAQAALDVLRGAGAALEIDTLRGALLGRGVAADRVRGVLRAENSRRSDLGLRPLFVLEPTGRIGLVEFGLSARYRALETAVLANLAEQQETVRRDLLVRVGALSDEAFARVVAVWLEGQGYAPVEVVHRQRENVALRARAGDPAGGTLAVVARRAWTSPGLQPIAALARNLAAFKADRGWFVTLGPVTPEAREAAAAAGVRLVDGEAFAHSLFDLGIGVATHRPTLRHVDGSFFESLE